ncbi:tRNA dimethylallyltransferase [Roseibium hamelinense]|uniref:tRNA dimethylallyltransferase n=1 Tax=Roseibium hamelinense TaxID=150831 RepID=A0A562TBC5_9HYPH|nr:tRNA (adenosine(37)-N6)-dimethylallyltransferase MiaA [Roseibium hamelinense]MTI45383.1 tRNA (adenosine(37)-N6)-dimethylallyltransferase MiaA [Roseibium hamelinense]TWI90246.1 tRNA dimethylallyltransferase [Roseibium hamelinense]
MGKAMVSVRAILIAGPTASGKSALALELAERLDGVIVNADSMQVYAELRVLTARPNEQDTKRAAHRLYGFVPASTAFSTGDWQRSAKREIEAICASGRLPIVVGGTGLYFKALTGGLAKVPDIDPAVRLECRQLAEEGGTAAVRAALAGLDPEASNTLEDLQRLTRALEVVRSTGRRLADWQQEAHGAPVLDETGTAQLVLAPPRPWLHARIRQRAEIILGEEGLSEVCKLLDMDLPATLPAMRAIGVSEAAALLKAELSAGEAAEQLTISTRQYAKRQETWFRNQMGHWPRLDPSQNCSQALAIDFMRKIEQAYP